MKLLKTKKSKVITLGVSAFVLLFTLAFIVSITGNRGEIGILEVYVPETEAVLERIETREPIVTRQRVSNINPSTTSSKDNSNTEPPVIEITLAPVEVPNESVREIIEENNVQVVPETAAKQTLPPRTEQRPSNATKIIDGQKNVWDPVLGWIPDYGEGTVIIMDVESDGEMYEGGW